jgi:hypothetical protein
MRVLDSKQEKLLRRLMLAAGGSLALKKAIAKAKADAKAAGKDITSDAVPLSDVASAIVATALEAHGT